MKTKVLFLLILPFFLSNCAPKETEGPASAENILKIAKKEARKEGKNVFIMWHASWCGWCHRMDTLMNDPEIQEYFGENYVIEHMVVKESKDNKHLENPGALELLTEFHGEKSGIPFWVILDEKGNLLADSYMREEGVGMDEPGKNTGCPAQPEEVAHFIDVLKTTSDISDEGLKKIADKFAR